MSSFNTLLIKKCPRGDIVQVIPVGSWKSPVPPSPKAAGAVLRECTGLSRQDGRLGRFLLQASLWTACFQPAAGHPLFLNYFLGVIGRMGVGPLSSLISTAEAGGARFFACFVLYLKSKD